MKFSKLEIEDFKRISQQGYSCWKWEVYREGMSIVLYGNSEEPYEKNLVMANEKLQEINNYVKVAEDRLAGWFYKRIKGKVVAIEFGQFYYYGEMVWENTFCITLVDEVNKEWDYLYTIKFKDDGWPVGAEIWSSDECDSLKENNYYKEEEYESLVDNSKIYQALVEYLREILKSKYPIEGDMEDLIYTNYIGTRALKGNIAMITLTEVTGNVVNDVYSNYGIKFMKKEGSHPIAIEFYIS